MANDEFFSGLNQTEAAFEWMIDNARPLAATANKLSFPEEFDPRPFVRIEDQGQRNSCVGNGLSSCGEICGWIDSGGTFNTQFSRWGAYIWSQSLSGPRPGVLWLGKDQGAGVDGAIRAATQIGFCPEELWPYPSPNAAYSTRVPAGAKEAADPYKLQGHSMPLTYEACFDWITQGKGPLLIGINWTAGLLDNRGDVTMRDLRTRSIGGHCVFLWGWRKNGSLPLGNSYTAGWGQQGWRDVVPEVVDYWARNRNIYAMTDLRDVSQSRPIMADFGEGW